MGSRGENRQKCAFYTSKNPSSYFHIDEVNILNYARAAMCRNRLFFLPALPMWLVCGAVADAGTLSSVTLAASAGPVMDPGSIPYCSGTSAGAVSCYMYVWGYGEGKEEWGGAG